MMIRLTVGVTIVVMMISILMIPILVMVWMSHLSRWVWWRNKNRTVAMMGSKAILKMSMCLSGLMAGSRSGCRVIREFTSGGTITS